MSEAKEAKLVEEVAEAMFGNVYIKSVGHNQARAAILRVAEWVDTKASKATQECEAYHMHYYAQELRAMCAEEGGEE